MRSKLFFLLGGLFFLHTFLFSQEQPITPILNPAQNKDVQLLYRNEQAFGLVVHSSGWGFNYRKCKHKTGYMKRVFETEAVGLRHPKEIKTQAISNSGVRGYFYGKQFVVTLLRGGYGYHKVITAKSERRGVELRLLSLIGPTIAFAKPVYLNILYPFNSNEPQGTTKTEKYDPLNPMHNQATILGRAGYFKGFDEMNFFPGGFFKLGLSFEHSNLDDEIKLLETGVVIDILYKTLPIMATTRNNQVYVNLYLNIMFGKKWF